jgi:hypothetical protein
VPVTFTCPESREPCGKRILGLKRVSLFAPPAYSASYARHTHKNHAVLRKKMLVFYSILIKIGIRGQILLKLPNFKFHENSFSGSRTAS